MPLIEAAHYGAPVIASDIPVFREVGGDAAVYFDVLDAQALSERVREALAETRDVKPPTVTTWRQSAARLVAMVRRDQYQISAAELAKALEPAE